MMSIEESPFEYIQYNPLPGYVPEPESVFEKDLFHIEYLCPTPFNLAKHLAERVTGLKNKDAAVLFVGNKGHGKTKAATGLAEGVMYAIHEAQRTRSLYDIFDWERDIASISSEKTLKCLNAKRPKSCVVLLDDMSISSDAREHQTKKNIKTSHVWITIRNLRAVIIGTTVEGSLIDIRERRNFNYVIKMKDDTRYDNLFGDNKGVRIGDLRGVYKDGITDEIKYPRIKLIENNNHIVLSNILCFPPSNDLGAYVDTLRDDEAEKLRRMDDESAKEQNTYTTSGTLEHRIIDKVMEYKERGEKVYNAQIARDLGTSKQYVGEIRKTNNV